MVDFVCPQVLGSLAIFMRVFDGPIQRAQDRNASQEDKALGEERSRCKPHHMSGFLNVIMLCQAWLQCLHKH